MSKTTSLFATLVSGALLAAAGRPTPAAAAGQGAVGAADGERPAGRIVLAPGVEAIAVAVGPAPTKKDTRAAEQLAVYLERITGRKLEVREVADTSIPKGVIAVGRLATAGGLIAQAELDPLARDGYVIRVAGGRAGICGWRELGTLYGVYALLERLGVRFYARDCEVVPQQAALVIPECALHIKPIYEFRKLAGNVKLGHTPTEEVFDPRRIGEKGSDHHSAAFLVPYKLYHEAHPEYFALQADGRRWDGKGNQHLCLSHPDVRRISAERLLDGMDRLPGCTFFAVTQGDGRNWCQCDACKALDAVPGERMADRLLDYVNAVARPVGAKHPDALFLTLAYTRHTEPPPERVKPDPNVRVMFCPYMGDDGQGCHSHDLTCERNTTTLERLTGWLAHCPNNMYIFDYPASAGHRYNPYGSFYAMKRKLDFYARNGIRGLYYCGIPSNFRDLFVYVQSRLHWQADADVEALIDEFMAAYYGAAAPHVRAYFDLMHKEVDERRVHQQCERLNPGLVTPALAERALESFRRAEVAVAGDAERLKRVRAEKHGVLFADLNERNPVNGVLAVDEETFARRLAEFLSISRALRVPDLGRSLGFDTWLYRIARLRISGEHWERDGLVDRLIKDPAETFRAERQPYSQTEVPGGWRIDLDAFMGGEGPAMYDNDCPGRQAVWIYGRKSRNPEMSARVRLDRLPAGAARLALSAQDDGHPGAALVLITINGEQVFRGPNRFRQNGWSEAEFPIPAGALQVGANEIKFTLLEDPTPPTARWFMLAECRVLFDR